MAACHLPGVPSTCKGCLTDIKTNVVKSRPQQNLYKYKRYMISFPATVAESKSWNGDYVTCKKPKYLACSPLQENGIINGTIYV